MFEKKLGRRELLYVAAGGVASAVLAGSLAAMWQNSSGGDSPRAEGGVLNILGRSGWHQPVNTFLFDYVKRHKLPNVQWQYDAKGYNETYQTAVLAMQQKSDRYDVMYLEDTMLYPFYKNGWLTPVGQYDTAGVPKRIFEYGTHGGQIYAVPSAGNNNFFFYNRRIVESVGETPPRSWDDVYRIAETVNERLGPRGVFGWSAHYPYVFTDAVILVLVSLGGRVFDPKDMVTPVFDSQEAVEALTIVKDLASPKRAHPKTLSWASRDDYGDAVYRGEVAMGITWVGWISQADNPSRSRVVGEIEVGPAPGRYRASVAGTWYWVVPATSRKKDLAIQFVKHITSYEVQKQAYLNVGLPPVRTKLFEDPEVRQRDRLIEGWARVLETAIPVRSSPVYIEVDQTLATIAQKAIIGDMPVESAVKQIHKTLVEASKKAGLI